MSCFGTCTVYIKSCLLYIFPLFKINFPTSSWSYIRGTLGGQSLSATLSQRFVVTPSFLCHGPAPAPAAPDADFSLRKGFVFSFALPLYHDRFRSYNQGLNFLSQNCLIWNKWVTGLFSADFVTEKQKQLLQLLGFEKKRIINYKLQPSFVNFLVLGFFNRYLLSVLDCQ